MSVRRSAVKQIGGFAGLRGEVGGAGGLNKVGPAWDIFKFPVQDAVHQIAEGGADKRGVPSSELVQHAAQRPEV